MRFCGECGNPTVPRARFCGHCGAPVRGSEPHAVETGGPHAAEAMAAPDDAWSLRPDLETLAPRGAPEPPDERLQPQAGPPGPEQLEPHPPDVGTPEHNADEPVAPILRTVYPAVVPGPPESVSGADVAHEAGIPPCPSCGGANTTDARFCEHCGHSLAEAATRAVLKGAATLAPAGGGAAPAPAQRAATEALQCSSCGAALEPGDRYCDTCGAPAQQAHPEVCPTCGQPWPRR